MDKSEFELKKQLIELQTQFEIARNKLKMSELEYLRQSDELHHEREMERGRIKSAEIRKMQMRKFSGDPYK